MFGDGQHYRNAVRATILYVVLSVPTELIAALAVAVALNRATRSMDSYRSIFHLPSLLGGSVAVAVLWKRVFGLDGLVNQLLLLVGIHGPSWVFDPRASLYTLVVLHIWQFGAPIVIFLAGLRQIASEYDAAAVDGAGRIRTFFSITIPRTWPAAADVITQMNKQLAGG